ncbi:hypothetical protein AB0I58_25010 [Spirillospora sp. NPDC050365]
MLVAMVAGGGLASTGSAAAAAETTATPVAAPAVTSAARWPVKCTYWVKVNRARVRKNPSLRSKTVRWKGHHAKITSPEPCGWYLLRDGRPWAKVNTTATRSHVGWMQLWDLE